MYKNRLLIIPQLPIKMRYQSWWLEEFATEFSIFFETVIVFGTNTKDNEINNFNFSDFDKAIIFENEIIKEYMSFELRKDDILLLNDISFPGLFPLLLFRKAKPKKCFAFCHATSINNNDYYEDVRSIKWPIENAVSKLFDKIFVATEYHKNKLSWDNSYVVGLPCHSKLRNRDCINRKKQHKIISVSRKNPQKTNFELEEFIEKIFGKIKRENFNTWEEYYNFVSESQILLSTASEETFGYNILDAVYNNCVPIAPNNFSYPELLDRKYLYDSKEELIEKIKSVEKGELKTPDCLLNQNLIDNFYKNVSLLMAE